MRWIGAGAVPTVVGVRMGSRARPVVLAGAAGAALVAGTVGSLAYLRAGASPVDVLRDVAVGWAFAAAGLVAWGRRPGNGTGPLLVAEGLTWFLGNLQGTSEPWLFALGAWWEALNLAVLGHLVLAFPEGRLAGRGARRLVAAGYALVAVGGLLRATTYDPAAGGAATAHLSCGGCGPNALLLLPDPGVFAAVDLTYHAVGAGLTVAVTAVLVRRWRRASPARRRALLPAWLSVLLAAAFVAWDLAYVAGPAAFHTVRAPLLVLSDASQVAVPFAFLLGVLRTRLRRAAVGNLVIEIESRPTPRRLRDALAEALGDPSLRLGLWSPAAGGYLDPDGRPLRLPGPDQPPTGTAQPPPDPDGRAPEQSPAVLAIPAAGRPGGARDVAPGPPPAVLLHDPALCDDPELMAAARAAARLGLENAWLRAELDGGAERAARARAEAAEARARIVRAADRERRRIERDLHDGAQSHLVVALMALRRVDSALPPHADEALRATVAEVDHTIRRALAELRELARGIYPAVLGREGLRAAVVALAERSPVPVVVAVADDRHPPEVEAAAYFTVCEAVVNAAKHARAQVVTVSAHAERLGGGRRLVVEVVDDGVGGADPRGGTGLDGLRERVTALGGQLWVRSPTGGGTRVRAELPVEPSPASPAEPATGLPGGSPCE